MPNIYRNKSSFVIFAIKATRLGNICFGNMLLRNRETCSNVAKAIWFEINSYGKS